MHPALVGATAHAKSGTLRGVHTLAGYLSLPERDVRFVFLFNDPKPYRYREKLLQKLAEQLVSQPAGDRDAR